MKRTDIIRGLFKLLKPLMPIMCLTVILGTVGYVCAAAVTVFGAFLILSVLGIAEGNTFNIIVALILSAVMRGLLRYAEQKSGHYIAFRELAVIRDRVFSALRRLAPAKLTERGQGDLANMVTSDIEQLEVFYAHTVAPVVIAVLSSVISVVFIANFSAVSALIAALAYVTVGLVIPVLTSKISAESGQKTRERLAKLNDSFLESLRGGEVTRQYGNTQKRREEMLKQTKQLLEYQRTIKKHEGITTALTGTAVVVFTVLCLVTGILANADFLSVVVTTVTLSATFGPVIALGNLSSTLSGVFASGERVLTLLDEEAEVIEVINGKKPQFNGLDMKNVTFGYDGESVLKDFNLKVFANKTVGLMGKSGCGKSTVLRLMMRFWECDSGEVLFSDENINNINSKHLVNSESFMTQSTDLFHGTILENIKIAKLDASYEEVREACKKAAIDEYITSLKDGYETEVGELGETLSAGERQRIGLARAFLHDAPLMLLDEPTANLDAMNEGIILRSINEHKGTVVVSSHRKSTLSICDEVKQM